MSYSQAGSETDTFLKKKTCQIHFAQQQPHCAVYIKRLQWESWIGENTITCLQSRVRATGWWRPYLDEALLTLNILTVLVFKHWSDRFVPLDTPQTPPDIYVTICTQFWDLPYFTFFLHSNPTRKAKQRRKSCQLTRFSKKVSCVRQTIIPKATLVLLM